MDDTNQTANNDSTAPKSQSSHPNICRLCLKFDESSINIFEEAESSDESKSESLIEQIFDLVKIKYEKSEALPDSICKVCLLAVKTFASFRERVKDCENELQRNKTKLGIESILSNHRPGLNGNPGNFVPEDNCIITEINPDQEYESSEDEFSLESDSDTENLTPAPTEHVFKAPLAQSTELQSVPTATKTPAVISVPQVASTDINLPSIGNYPTDYTPKNTFQCQYCDIAFTSQKDCMEHETRHDMSTPFACNFCPLQTASRQALINHIRNQHDSERPYICPLCSKGFGRRSDLKKHTIVHTGVRPFTCHLCTKSFSRNTNLTKHLRIHSSLKPHVCTICPRSFQTSAELLRHKRNHAELKPYPCNRCHSSFSRRDKLLLHQQAHFRREAELLRNHSNNTNNFIIAGQQDQTNNQMENVSGTFKAYNENEMSKIAEDPYRNSILAATLQQRPFVPKPTTTQPSKTHSRNYTCEVCAKSFTRDRDLQRHRALHLDQLFKCNQCGLGFNRQEKLTRHEQEVHGPQYPCGVCGMTFNKAEPLATHFKIHELQQNATKAVLNATSVGSGAHSTGLQVASNVPFATSQMTKNKTVPPPSVADLSFYSQMVPTMNLGFYSETFAEDRSNI